MILVSYCRGDERNTAKRLLRYGAKSLSLELSPEDLAASEKGKPYDIKGRFHFSISHSDGVAAVLTDSSPCGIDVQKKREFSQKLIDKMCTEEEKAQITDSASATALWTLKEAYLKKTGEGISGGLTSVSFILPKDLSGKVEASVPHSFYLYSFGEYFLSVCFDEKEKAEQTLRFI